MYGICENSLRLEKYKVTVKGEFKKQGKEKEIVKEQDFCYNIQELLNLFANRMNEYLTSENLDTTCSCYTTFHKFEDENNPSEPCLVLSKLVFYDKNNKITNVYAEDFEFDKMTCYKFSFVARHLPIERELDHYGISLETSFCDENCQD